MARKAASNTARGRKAQQKHGSMELLSKLKFIAQAQKKDGASEAHCLIAHNRVVGFDGCFSVGAPIDEDFTACPHTHALIAALSKCGDTVAIVADESRVSVISGKLTVNVQSAPLEAIFGPGYEPDRKCAVLNNELKKGFEIVGQLAKEGALRLPLATLLLEAEIVSATNGYAAMQYRHGIDLPPGLVLPKRFCDMVVRNPANLTGFGWTPDVSVTFWFEDETFIKTQLQRGVWPDVNNVLNHNSNPAPLPNGFAEAIETVSSFSDIGRVVFKHGHIMSDPNKATIATFECPDIPDDRDYNGKTLAGILPFIESADMKSFTDRLFFFGCDGNMRGVIMGIRDK